MVEFQIHLGLFLILLAAKKLLELLERPCIVDEGKQTEEEDYRRRRRWLFQVGSPLVLVVKAVMMVAAGMELEWNDLGEQEEMMVEEEYFPPFRSSHFHSMNS